MEKDLENLLLPYGRPELCTSLLPALLDGIAGIAESLHQSHHVSQAGTTNAFGDGQLNVDISAENIIRAALARCPSVLTASSEEEPVERAASDNQTKDGVASTAEQYTVAFDPLDGSSIIAPNWTVGTIIGIWDGASAINQQPSTKQVAAVMGVYGPRTTAVVALNVPGGKPSCIEIGIGKPGSQDHQLIRPNLHLAEPPFKTRYFAPANLRAAAESEAYMRLITQFVEKKYTLRYSGGLVPDILHALVKGHGVYISPVTSASDAKLRRLYELFPIALVILCAGGKAVDPANGEDILSRPVMDCDERAGLICGTADEVDNVMKALLGA
ncbi:sedoheptulose-1-7-bisphosphatase [Penicillium capsulatum]|uniref:Sedoheptulose-1-7-bisphosphatase n=1 Tax=Penicillium capsulatum TaxID=69766 RepID=A0A9W9LLI3_9EURO|nr:sedoheptulose-1-7-bisphosphatase [Penicillium capsulatum]KAJ6116658.1 sedoheptulose-1-7-bisphosphatase [Penicillium capsulatum]